MIFIKSELILKLVKEIMLEDFSDSESRKYLPVIIDESFLSTYFNYMPPELLYKLCLKLESESRLEELKGILSYINNSDSSHSDIEGFIMKRLKELSK